MREVIESVGQSVPLTKVCAAVGVPRSTLYRLRKPPVDKPQEPRRSSRALGYAARLSEIGVRLFEPLLQHKHLAVDQAVSETADVPQMNAHLRVGHLAHRTTVLWGDADRVPTLFDHTRFIDQHHAIHFSQRLGHQSLVNHQDWLLPPRALANEMLQIAHIFVQAQSNPLTCLTLRIAQQTLQIDFTPPKLIATMKRRRQKIEIRLQFCYKLLYIVLAQVALWRRASFAYQKSGYNSLRHGIVSFSLDMSWKTIP
jgi:hypothetical protein